MEFSLERTVEVLSRTPRVIRSLLDGIDHEWVLNNYGPKTFSPFDVVGHLIHGERTDWIGRARIIMEQGESRPFDPFDRYAQYEESKGRSIGNLLAEFESLRADNLRTLKSWDLTVDQLDLRGTHPELGTVTIRQLLATWTVHDLHHVAQICKSMSFQYGGEVGAWRAYLGILPQPAPA